MAGTTQYVPFATGAGALVIAPTTYAADSQLAPGAQPGIARVDLNNTTLRQCSMVAAAITQFIANELNTAINDDGNLTNLVTNLTNAINAAVAAGIPSIPSKPTVTLKQGTGSGNYTTTSTSLVAVDATNLAYTVTVPVGWKLIVTANASAEIGGGGASGLSIALNDSIGGTLAMSQFNVASGIAGMNVPISVQSVITGDGNSHTIKLMYAETYTGGCEINNSLGYFPTMTFVLTQSN